MDELIQESFEILKEKIDLSTEGIKEEIDEITLPEIDLRDISNFNKLLLIYEDMINGNENAFQNSILYQSYLELSKKIEYYDNFSKILNKASNEILSKDDLTRYIKAFNDQLLSLEASIRRKQFSMLNQINVNETK